jgi:hypothetical protein
MPVSSNLITYFANYTDTDWLKIILTFHVTDSMSSFRYLDHTKESIQVS